MEYFLYIFTNCFHKSLQGYNSSLFVSLPVPKDTLIMRVENTLPQVPFMSHWIFVACVVESQDSLYIYYQGETLSQVGNYFIPENKIYLSHRCL